jgi:glutamine synthetase
MRAELRCPDLANPYLAFCNASAAMDGVDNQRLVLGL